MDRCPTTGKIRYPTRKRALQRLAELRAGGVLTLRHHTYRCPHASCRGWHLGRMRRAAWERFTRLVDRRPG